MDFNFRGTYDSSKNYVKKDVVSYQPTSNDSIKYYFCLTNHTNASPQAPSPASDTIYWGLMNASSNFPNNVDSFLYRSTIQASDRVDIERINALAVKPNLTETEQNELSSLTQKHRNKLLLADDINAIQQSISNLQMFYKDKVEARLNENILEINTTKDSVLASIEAKKNNVIEYMDGTTAGAIRNDIGIMGELDTSEKTSLVAAINEVNSKEVNLDPINNKIGDLTILETIEKTNLVDAINEIKTEFTTHSAEDATILEKGHVQLSNAVTSTDETKAATSKAVKTAMDRANEAFQSANDGKTAVANAITAKGVSASPTETFSALADKIGQLNTSKVAKGSFTATQYGTTSIENLTFKPDYVVVKYGINPSNFMFLDDKGTLVDPLKVLIARNNSTLSMPNRSDAVAYPTILPTGFRHYADVSGTYNFIAIKE